jgi:hypothetical protein
MKGPFTLSLYLLLAALPALSQDTSPDEYKYMLNNVKSAIENGRPVKKGYFLRDRVTFSSTEDFFAVTFINLLRKDDTHAGIVAVLKNESINKTYYIPIPALNSTGDVDIETTTIQSVRTYNLGTELSNFFYQSLANYFSQPIAKTGLPTPWSDEKIKLIKRQVDYSAINAREVSYDRVFTKVEQEAQFPGGAVAWRGFLERNLRSGVALDDGARPGSYTIKLQFIVDTLGQITNVHTVDVPRECPSCGKEGIRIIRKSPLWIPAEQNHHKVVYQATQFITFSVVNR